MLWRELLGTAGTHFIVLQVNIAMIAFARHIYIFLDSSSYEIGRLIDWWRINTRPRLISSSMTHWQMNVRWTEITVNSYGKFPASRMFSNGIKMGDIVLRIASDDLASRAFLCLRSYWCSQFCRFSAEALRDRIQDFNCRVVITGTLASDEGRRRGGSKTIGANKVIVDASLNMPPMPLTKIRC